MPRTCFAFRKLGTQGRWGRYSLPVVLFLHLGVAQLNCQGAQFQGRQAVDQTYDPISGLSSIRSVSGEALGLWSFNTGWVLDRQWVQKRNAFF
jgi:hypothetical protein